MAQDRTYFRMLSDTALAEAARYCDNDLALVLGERLARSQTHRKSWRRCKYYTTA
jgi:hypothetical protein